VPGRRRISLNSTSYCSVAADVANVSLDSMCSYQYCDTAADAASVGLWEMIWRSILRYKTRGAIEVVVEGCGRASRGRYIFLYYFAECKSTLMR
jgi:hypothetical protein